MRHKKLRFPKYINRPKLLFIVERDVVTVIGLCFVAIYIIMTMMGAKILLIVLSALGGTFLITTSYVSYKKRAAKGFLWHWLYKKGLWREKEDERKFNELKYMDNPHWFPEGTDYVFTD